MRALSAHMAAAGNRALPEEAAEHARHHLLDTLAAMLSGSELPPGQAALRHLRAYGGPGRATVAASGLTAAPADAALANGVMAHADETDDSHNASRSHPSARRSRRRSTRWRRSAAAGRSGPTRWSG